MASSSIIATRLESDLIDMIGKCCADPLRYVLTAFDWGHGDLARHFGPDEWQRDLLQKIGDEVLTVDAAIQEAVASGHGVGKSALVAWIILWAMSTRPHLAGVVTANTKTQLETKTWRELAIWHKRAINEHWFDWTATKFAHKEHPETWAVSAIPWTKERSEAFAGLHGEYVLVIFDEASAIDDIIWEVTEGALTTKGAMWFAFGNPTRNTGRFRECWGKFRHRWGTRQVDSRKARMANLVKVEQWITDYGDDSDFVRIRVKGEFPRAGNNQFIGSDLVERAMGREPLLDIGAPLIIGVDVARFGSNQSVIFFRRGRDAKSITPLKYRGLDLMDLSDRVAGIIEKFKPDAVNIDGTGLGAGVVDRLKQLGYRVNEIIVGRPAKDEKVYMNKRAELWGEGKAWLETGALCNDPELRDDLIGPEYGFDNKGRYQLEKKEDMEERGLSSPDVGDAFMLTFAVNVPRKDSQISKYFDRFDAEEAPHYWGED